MGKLVSTIEDDVQAPGEYTYRIDAGKLEMSAGVYRIRLTLDDKMTFVKQLIQLK